MNPFSVVDCIILAVILLLAFEQLRLITFYREPLRSLTFVLLCIGAFGKLTWLFGEHAVSWPGVSMDAGFMLYGIRMWSHKFTAQRKSDAQRLPVSHLRRTL